MRTLPTRIAPANLFKVAPPASQGSQDPFYQSAAYQRWRDGVIARAGGVCQFKGCGRAERRMFANHIVEVKDDPSRRLDPSNGECLCGKHHSIVTARARAKRLAMG